MRKVIIICITFLIILLISPILASVIINNDDSSENTDKRIIIEKALELCDEDFCDEAIKAILAITENNYALENNKLNLKIKRSKYSKEFYSRAEKLYDELEINIHLDNTKVYIPTATLSKGYTKRDEQYAYMKSVASPWDCFNEKFVYKKDYPCGVSLEGINFLCNEGMSYKDALKWYLPMFKIK